MFRMDINVVVCTIIYKRKKKFSMTEQSIIALYKIPPHKVDVFFFFFVSILERFED